MPRWDDDAEVMRKAVRWALLDAWVATLPNSFTPPQDFRRVASGQVRFEPGVFADKVAALLVQRGFTIQEKRVDGTAIEKTEPVESKRVE